MNRPLNPYMVHDGEPSEGAVLVLAHTAKDARRIGYPEVSSWTGAECTQIRAKRIRKHIEYLLSLATEPGPHCIDDVPTCHRCEVWGAPQLPGGGCDLCPKESA